MIPVGRLCLLLITAIVLAFQTAVAVYKIYGRSHNSEHLLFHHIKWFLCTKFCRSGSPENILCKPHWLLKLSKHQMDFKKKNLPAVVSYRIYRIPYDFVNLYVHHINWFRRTRFAAAAQNLFSFVNPTVFSQVHF
jgi:hypothetical protein